MLMGIWAMSTLLGVELIEYLSLLKRAITEDNGLWQMLREADQQLSGLWRLLLDDRDGTMELLENGPDFVEDALVAA